MINNISKEQISQLLAGYKSGRYLEDHDLLNHASFTLLIDNVYNTISKEENQIISIKDTNGDLEGLILFKISEWDSLHFEKKTVLIENIFIKKSEDSIYQKNGETLLNIFLQWCVQNSIKFVVSKIPSLDLLTIHCLERIGFRFIESWIYNKFDLRKAKPLVEDQLSLRFAKDSDLEYMLEYSKNAFITQRFHADHNLSYEKAESVYFKWIVTSFNDPNQNILVYDHLDIPSAFMIYYSKDLSYYFNLKFAMWKMALINPKITGKGIGAKFFSSVCDHHRQENMDVVDSGLSLRNIVSMNTHNKANFKVVSTLVTMHLWL
jgi:hypothetical protein